MFLSGRSSWFAMVVRNGVALIAVLLVLIFVVRPLMKMARGKGGKPVAADPSGEGEGAAQIMPPEGGYDREGLDAQIELAQRIAREQPQDAVLALRRMLAEPVPGQMAEGTAR